MDLTFYKQAATPNRLDKSGYLTVTGTLSNVVLKDTVNLFAPVFILKTNAVVYNSNYLYCSYTGRYYYIETIEALSGGRIAVHCRVDVLHTYRNEIKSSSGWVIRSAATSDESDNYNMLHNDFPFRSDYTVLGCDLSNQGLSNPFNWVGTTGVGYNILMIVK